MKYLIGAALMVVGVSAQAESVTLNGTFPAGNEKIGAFRSVGVLPFTGTDGPALSIAIERALNAADGHFTVYAATAGGQAAPDGIISGVVTTGVTETNYTTKEDKCTTWTSGKCTATTVVEHKCIRRVIELRSDIRVVDNATSGIVFSQAMPKREEISWCDAAQPQTTVETAVRTMIDATAHDFRMLAAPHNETYKVRFLESTKGFDKPTKQTFKAAIKQTQRDLSAACAQFDALAGAGAAGHPSIAYNQGVCAEAAKDYAAAGRYYVQAMFSGADGAEESQQRALGLEAQRAAAAAR
ncbi:MAG: hypothetical protein GW859_08965 [Sphingomonadales bacterium]|nr:hypothetical protein [Sphingomonadales bacterium]